MTTEQPLEQSYQTSNIDRYKSLILPRLIEEKMLLLLRKGQISKWFSGIGQEAIAVGATLSMQSDEFILPMHRNLGVFTTRDIPLEKLFAQLLGTHNGFTKGRDRSFHFGTLEHAIIGMISHIGANLPVAAGVALASKLSGKQKAVLSFSGDGGTSEGDFHEAVNLAAVWGLPVIFLIENNGWSISTPTEKQFKCESLADKGIGYGIPAQKIDGNNFDEVCQTITWARNKALDDSTPVLIEAHTYRMRGHEEASGIKYMPQHELEAWAKLDPIHTYEKQLLTEEGVTTDTLTEIKATLNAEIDSAIATVLDNASAHTADIQTELNDVFATSAQTKHQPDMLPDSEASNLRFVDSLNAALHQAMEKHPQLVLMGQDIGNYGGVFKVTEGLQEKFGEQRVRDTPLCESAVIGAGLGLSIGGYKSVVEMQFADFVSCGFNQIVNNLAKSHYRWGMNADVVIRMPTGAGNGAGPFHSQSNESWFTHVPGLKVVYPSNPVQAKGLLLSSIEDPNPVLFFEHKALYRSLSEDVPNAYFTYPIGQGHCTRSGERASIITYGMGVHWAEKAVEALDADVEIIDLVSLAPWDKEIVKSSIQKTGKALVCYEDTLTGGFGAEVCAWIAEHCFENLDAPVMREGSLDTPIPFSKPLENTFLPAERIVQKLKVLLDY